MADDARAALQERFAKIGERVLARLHSIHPHLHGKSLEETTSILKAEESSVRSSRLTQSQADAVSTIERLLALGR